MMSPTNRVENFKSPPPTRMSKLPPILKANSSMEARTPKPKTGHVKLSEKRSSSVMQVDRANSSMKVSPAPFAVNNNSLTEKRNERSGSLPVIEANAANRKTMMKAASRQMFNRNFSLEMNTPLL